jgi:hypothetical protein
MFFCAAVSLGAAALVRERSRQDMAIEYTDPAARRRLPALRRT